MDTVPGWSPVDPWEAAVGKVMWRSAGSEGDWCVTPGVFGHTWPKGQTWVMDDDPHEGDQNLYRESFSEQQGLWDEPQPHHERRALRSSSRSSMATPPCPQSPPLVFQVEYQV